MTLENGNYNRALKIIFILFMYNKAKGITCDAERKTTYNIFLGGMKSCGPFVYG